MTIRTDRARRRPIRKRRTFAFAATAELLESRKLLTAIVAANDTLTVLASSPPLTVDVLANDVGGSGALSIYSVGSLSHGSAVIQHSSTGGPDTLLVTPAAGYAGTESFNYVATDSAGDYDSATVTLTFTNASVPQLSSISSTSGPTAGGTSVTITGTSLSSVNAVYFGGVAATDFTGPTIIRLR